MAFGVEKRFFAVHVVRHSRLLRRRGLVMDGTLNDMQMYSKVILLPTQSPHVCVLCSEAPTISVGTNEVTSARISTSKHMFRNRSWLGF